MISQFYILSPRGDTIITRDFRGDIVKGTAEIFFRKVKFWKGDAPPIFNSDGINYCFVKNNGLFFVATTTVNISPCFVVELLTTMTKVFKDYCGVLNEESIRKNFVLVYELLDEAIDFGFPQSTSTEILKDCVFNTPVMVEAPKTNNFTNFSMNTRTVPSSAVHRPVVAKDGNKKNEIFVDILEKLTVCLNANGYVVNSAIDGHIQMKSYLSGNPDLKLALNDDLCIGKEGAMSSGSVVLDDCNFHECVDLTDFEHQRILSFYPPDGEFSVMNYRITSDYRVPFRIFPTITVDEGDLRAEIVIKVRAEIPEQNYGSNVVLSCSLPKSTHHCSFELHPGGSGQTTEYVQQDQKFIWNLRKFQGGGEHSIKAKVSFASPCRSVQKETGPISMNFEIPMFNVSNLNVKYLKINQVSNNKPFRWVRYVTFGASYVCRF
jgi:AP-4 complex subunit mu-1